MAQHQGDQSQVLKFIVQNTHICINLTYVDQVLPLMRLEPVPGSAPSLAGLMNLGGNSIPVIDLGICLGLNRTQKYSLDTPILLCSEKEQKLGLVIDSIFGLEEITGHSFQMTQAFEKLNSPFLGVIETTEGLSLLMNMECIFKSYVHGENVPLIFDHRMLAEARNENP